MRLLPALMFCGALFAKDSFITQEEYGRQLYHNPRGIGCHLCHGEKGEGRLVARYEHKNVKKTFTGPAIASLDFKRFSEALGGRVAGMPRYFLTDREIMVLYSYLKAGKNERK